MSCTLHGLLSTSCVPVSGTQGVKVMTRAVIVVERQTRVPTSLLPFVGVREGLLHCLSGEVDALAELLYSNVKSLTLCVEFECLVLQVLDVLSCALKDSTLILPSSWNYFRNVLDAFVDDFTASSFNCLGCQLAA